MANSQKLPVPSGGTPGTESVKKLNEKHETTSQNQTCNVFFGWC